MALKCLGVLPEDLGPLSHPCLFYHHSCHLMSSLALEWSLLQLESMGEEVLKAMKCTHGQVVQLGFIGNGDHSNLSARRSISPEAGEPPQFAA